MKDIRGLPARPHFDDVEKLLKGYMFAEGGMYRCPAKEGGIYFFSFFPTHEAPLPTKSERGRPVLVAVISGESLGEVLKGKGKYVFPPQLAGHKFTGFEGFDRGDK
jgi:hypothetical protein